MKKRKARLILNYNKSILTAFLVIFLAFAFQGSRGLYETTEGRYAEVAREMLETGDWLTPQLDYQPHLTKPPLTYWVIAGGMFILGENEWGVRLGNSLAYLILIYTMLLFGKVLWKEPFHFLSALMLAVSGFMIAATYMISTDLLLTLFEFLSVFYYWKALAEKEPSRQKIWIILLWISSGLSFLTKGPPGLLSLLVIIIFHIYIKKRGMSLPKLFSFRAVVAFLVVAIPWYIYVILAHKGLLSYFWKDEIIGRVITNKFNRNPQWYKPFLIYGIPLVLGSLPWLLWWPRILLFLKKYLKKHRFLDVLQTNYKFLFFLLWLAIPLIILSISSSRLPFYVLPFFPALIMITAFLLIKIYNPGKLLRKIQRVANASIILFIIAKGLFSIYPSEMDMKKMFMEIENNLEPGTSVILIDDKKLYGLQFYLKGNLRRVDLEQEEVGIFNDLNNLLNKYEHDKSDQKMLFLTSKKGMFLKDLLSEKGIHYQQQKINKKYWSFILKTGNS